MSAVPIIIPFFREYAKLEKCKAAIAAQTYAGCEVFVRDNTHDNILFTAAVNEGLARYCWRPDVRYVIVLNQDAYMKPDCVQQLVDFMDAHPDCGVACPIQCAEGTSQVTWGGSWEAFPFGRHRKEPLASYREPFETFWANGACMMIRAETIREVGMFDRNMRFICSDSDFSFTARSRGWKVFVVPQARAEHSLGASNQANVEISLVKCRDALYFAQKWLTGGVYRRLAFEGPGLHRTAVRQWAERMRHDVHVLERQAGASSKASLLSMMAEWNQPPQPRAPGRY